VTYTDPHMIQPSQRFMLAIRPERWHRRTYVLSLAVQAEVSRPG